MKTCEESGLGDVVILGVRTESQGLVALRSTSIRIISNLCDFRVVSSDLCCGQVLGCCRLPVPLPTSLPPVGTPSPALASSMTSL